MLLKKYLYIFGGIGISVCWDCTLCIISISTKCTVQKKKCTVLHFFGSLDVTLWTAIAITDGVGMGSLFFDDTVYYVRDSDGLTC